tara:strand:+ start:49338 stop:51674 length:2337 start_codon:yes stop_codon:yes gene_type:complete
MISLEYLIKNPIKDMFRTTSLLLFFFFFADNVQSQNWDYDKYPNRNVIFTHLDADIQLSDDPMILGDIIYTASVLRDSVRSIRFNAVGMNIISVEVNGNSMNHRFQNNYLIVELKESYERSEVIQIRIQYDTNPYFGIHKNVNGTVWSSLLPNSIQHWMPVFENPEAQITTDLVFTHSSDMSVVSNGRRGVVEIISVNESRTGFSSNIALPITGISFVLSDFSDSISTINAGIPGFGRRGDPQIHIYSENEIPGLEELLIHAVQTYRSVEEYVTNQYPFRDLHFVILEDDYLEVKNYAAGVIYLYMNRGDLRYQIERAVTAQWAGIYLREYQWDNPDAILFLQAAIMNDLFEFEKMNENPDLEPYHKLSDDELFRWVQFMKSAESEALKNDFSLIKESLFNDGMKAFDWDQLSLKLYNESGRNYFDGIELIEIREQEPITSEYSVNIEWDEIENRLDIYFESEQNPINELVTLELVEINLTEQKVHELSFTGENDGVVVSVSPSVEYVKFNPMDREDIILKVTKPFLFWIAQLRVDPDPEKRIEAAKGLAGIRDNPDLQLALNDILRTESNPQVYAEIIRSMSVLTKGASGTEERFIQYSTNDQHEDVRLAAIDALGSYPGNERVIGRLNSIITQTTNEKLRVQSINSLAAITTAERFGTMARSLVTRESVLNQVPLILNKLAEKGETPLTVELAESFLADTFPYSIRLQSLKIIQKFDQSSSNWMRRLPNLLTDRHPGIRLAATESLSKVSSQQRNTLINDVIENEYDERVRQGINN